MISKGVLDHLNAAERELLFLLDEFGDKEMPEIEPERLARLALCVDTLIVMELIAFDEDETEVTITDDGRVAVRYLKQIGVS